MLVIFPSRHIHAADQHSGPKLTTTLTMKFSLSKYYSKLTILCYSMLYVSTLQIDKCTAA